MPDAKARLGYQRPNALASGKTLRYFPTVTGNSDLKIGVAFERSRSVRESR
jgi:hypothetical protein